MEEQKSTGEPVQKLYQALNQQDLDAFDSFVSDDVSYMDFSLNEKIEGKEAFKRYFKNWWTAFPTGTGAINNMIISDDQVVVEALGRGDQTGIFTLSHSRVEPTNRVFEFHFCQVFRVKSGKIVMGHSYSDSSQLLAFVSEERKVA